MIRKLLCLIGLHFGGVESNRTGLWFACKYCNHTSGFVPRSQIDKMINRDLEKRDVQ